MVWDDTVGTSEAASLSHPLLCSLSSAPSPLLLPSVSQSPPCAQYVNPNPSRSPRLSVIGSSSCHTCEPPVAWAMVDGSDDEPNLSAEAGLLSSATLSSAAAI